MRKLTNYDEVFCDIDNTLVYGFITDLMDWTWARFHNQTIARILMYIQAHTKWYKINVPLLWRLTQCNDGVITFLTARCPDNSTLKLLSDILPDKKWSLYSLATDRPAHDKIAFITSMVAHPISSRQVLIDDNLLVNLLAFGEGVDYIYPNAKDRDKWIG